MSQRLNVVRIGLLVLALMAAGAMAGVSAQTLTFTEPNFIRSLDPANQFDLMDLYVYRHIYDALVEILPGGRIGPKLATSWEVSDDGLEWTFHLREGVVFHNGEPFDAHDVKFTFERLKDRAIRQSFLFPTLEEVTVVDPLTVRIRTSSPMGVFLNNAAMVSILPSETFAQRGNAFFEKPVGTGPFKFVEYVRDVRYVMEKNENYWRPDVARVDRLVLRPIFEEATVKAALEAGEIDIASAISPDLALALQGVPSVQVLYAPSVETTFLQVNVTKGPLGNPKVIEALNYAIDREEITEGLFFGEATPAGAYVPPGLVGHHAGLKPFPYDPAKAKQLLAEAGYPNGLTIKLTGPAGLWPQTRNVMEAIREQAKAAGFNIELEILESAAYVQARGSGNYELLYGSSIAVTHEGIRFLDERVRRDVHKSNYVNEEVNALIEKLQATIDPAEQQALFEEVQEIMYGGPPMIYLFYPPHIYAVRTSVKGFEPRPDRSLHLWGVTKE